VARKVVTSYAVFDNVGGTRDIVFYYQGGGADSVSGVSADEAHYIVDLLRNETPMSYDHALRRLSTWTAEPVGEAERTVDLDAWLAAHPLIAFAIVWEDGGGAHMWWSWSAGWRGELRQAFDLARLGSSIAVAEVPPNQASLADGDFATTILSPGDAWAYFKASVAQSLAAEIDGHVGWSVLGYSADQLAQLFDGRRMFAWNGSPAGYRIDSMHGQVVPAPPSRSYEFLGAGGLIGYSRLDTIVRLVDWCRSNLVHFTGDTTAASTQDQWQYRGFPPLARVLAGTVQTSHPDLGSMHRTAGCWGTTGLFRALLRAVNVPVELVTNAGHAQPRFMSEARYLSHGDDPYNRLTKATPPIPAAEIPIGQATFDAWFGAGVSATDRDNNIGRRTRELAVQYLPNYLLNEYCSDTAAGKSHANGEVFATLSRNYTVQLLEGLSLWTRMDAKIAGFGGCAYVP
jgi:hypothetical protein